MVGVEVVVKIGVEVVVEVGVRVEAIKMMKSLYLRRK